MKPSYLDIKTISSPGQCLSWWLVHSYLYYVMGESLITDHEWNTLGKWLFYDWSAVKDHPHAHLVDIELGASSAFYISENQYPIIVKNVAWSLWKWDQNCKLRKKLALRRGRSST